MWNAGFVNMRWKKLHSQMPLLGGGGVGELQKESQFCKTAWLSCIKHLLGIPNCEILGLSCQISHLQIVSRAAPIQSR
jgi:hypothetical protein